MNTPADDGAFDPDRILATLDAHGVDHLLVGGFAARAHGATRPTADIDCVPDTDAENYARLASALRELGARLRVGGMPDGEARQLPIVIDARTLRNFGNSTWMTDAGPLDLLVELRDRDGGRHSVAELATRAVPHDVGGVIVRLAALHDIVASKDFATVRRTGKHSRSRTIGHRRRLRRVSCQPWWDECRLSLGGRRRRWRSGRRRLMRQRASSDRRS